MILKAFLFYCASLLSTSVCIAQNPQMELRENEEYDSEQFRNSKPAVGTSAPELKLQTLDGNTVSLSDYRGKRIVVIKSGYT